MLARALYGNFLSHVCWAEWAAVPFGVFQLKTKANAKKSKLSETTHHHSPRTLCSLPELGTVSLNKVFVLGGDRKGDYPTN